MCCCDESRETVFVNDGGSCEPAGLGRGRALRGERGSLLKENTLLMGQFGQTVKSWWLWPLRGSPWLPVGTEREGGVLAEKSPERGPLRPGWLERAQS